MRESLGNTSSVLIIRDTGKLSLTIHHLRGRGKEVSYLQARVGALVEHGVCRYLHLRPPGPKISVSKLITIRDFVITLHRNKTTAVHPFMMQRHSADRAPCPSSYTCLASLSCS